MDLTVVVLTFDSAATVEACLASLASQTHRVGGWAIAPDALVWHEGRAAEVTR